MSVVTVAPGDLIVLDPSDKRIVEFDWDEENLADAVTIVDSVFRIGNVRVRSALAVLTKDNPIILSGSRKTQVRLDATTASVGDRYELANAITTSETPAQIKEQSIRILIQNR